MASGSDAYVYPRVYPKPYTLATMSGVSTRTRPLSRLERQESILLGAARAFAHTGYAGTSMEDIAAESRITKLIVYRHFDSKEDLYRATLDRIVTRLAEEFVAAVSEGTRTGIGTRSFLTVARENPDGFRLLWRHAAREPQFSTYAEKLRERVVFAARALLSDRLPDGAFRTWAAETLVSLLVEAIANWLEFGTPTRDDQFVDLMSSSIRAMIETWGSQSYEPTEATNP